MVAELNLVIALLIWVLAVGVVASHVADHDVKMHHAPLGAVLIVLATVNLVSAAPVPLGLGDYTEAFRFGAAFLRGIALVLLVAYAWYRVEQGYRRR